MQARCLLAGREPGFFSRLFVDCGFLTSDLQRSEQCPPEFLTLRINKCMLLATTWQTPLHVSRDLEMHFNKIKVSTASTTKLMKRSVTQQLTAG